MKIVAPISVTDALLTSSNIPENDATEWATGQSVTASTGGALGSLRMVTTSGSSYHNVYECLIDHTTDNDKYPPDEPLDANGLPYWRLKSKTNRWNLFGNTISDQSIGTTDQVVIYEITLGAAQVVNGMAFFNIENVATIQIEVNHNSVVIYDNTIRPREWVQNNYYGYFYPEFISSGDTALDDLPNRSGVLIRLTVTPYTGEQARIGNWVFGKIESWGNSLITQNQVTTGARSFSKINRNVYGQLNVVQRESVKKASFRSVLVPRNRHSEINQRLADLDGEIVLWIGDKNEGATVLLGLYTSFGLSYADTTYSTLDVDIEGIT